MKKIIVSAAVFGLYCMFGGKKAYAWYGSTHADITKKALVLLEKENMSKAVDFYSRWHEQIILGSKQPDFKGDCDNGSGTHYYSCVNRRGKSLASYNGYYLNRLGKAMRSARTLFEENYTCAVSLYKSGDTKNAMLYLGRAIHFVEDMGCTVHTANMICIPHKKNVHSNFERYASDICGDITAERFDKRFSKLYQKDNMGEALNSLIHYASKFSQSIRSLDKKDFANAAGHVLPYTQENVMALLLRFYRDCLNDNGNYLKNGEEYKFINLATKEAVTASDKGFIMKKCVDDRMQRFRIEISNNGSFGIKCFGKEYADKKCRGHERLDDGVTPAQFRAAAVGDRIFRISAESGGYKKVLTVKRGGLCFDKFRPDNAANYWIIRP